MSTKSLGKVTITPKGAWNSSYTYKRLDVVTNAGASFIALTDVPANTATSNGSYWMKLAAKGESVASVAAEKTDTTGAVDTYTVTFTYTDESTDTITLTVTNGSVTSVAGKTGDVTLGGGDVGYDGTASYSSGTVGAEVSNLKSALQQLDIATAKTSGDYPELTSGSAGQMLSNNGVTDKVPYVYRKSGGEGADRAKECITGGTVCWNQLAPEQFLTDTTYWGANNASVSIADRIVKVTASAQNGYTVANIISFIVPGHRLLVMMRLKLTTGTTDVELASWMSGVGTKSKATANTTGWQEMYLMLNPTASVTAMNVTITDKRASGWDEIQFTDFVMFDLTAMFGSTIADYLATLETATAGSGIALLRSWGFFTKPYYAYNAGELMSVQAASKKLVGFNQWDGEFESGYYDTSDNGAPKSGSNWRRIKNPIIALPSTEYYLNIPVGYSNSFGAVLFYTASGDYISAIDSNYSTFTTPANCRQIKWYARKEWFEGVTQPFCLSFSDSILNGTYKPYETWSYAFDSSLTLRGIPKLDSNNKLYYDGDKYEPDGTVTRRYGSVDLGTLGWVNYKTGGFNAFIENAKAAGQNTPSNVFIIGYVPKGSSAALDSGMMTITGGKVYIVDSNFTTDAAAFKTAMSGAYLVYELATPTTETADPYQEWQLSDPYGTEEFVDAGVTASTPTRDVSIPVGHDTWYPQNSRAKLDGLPSNFSTLIAPTEATYKATQNYTSGDLFIVNNILYKATANIANNGTITPNTNCIATTLAAVIAALN